MLFRYKPNVKIVVENSKIKGEKKNLERLCGRSMFGAEILSVILQKIMGKATNGFVES